MKRMMLTAGLVMGGLVNVASGQDLDGLTKVREARSRRIASNHAEASSNADNRWVKPGATHTVAEIAGAGVIRHLWLTFADAGPSWLSKEGSADPSEVVVRMYWDGAKEPAVEAPLGDFFAVGFGKRAEVNSAPVVVGGAGGDAYNCYWAMPFRTGARITLTNESERPFAALYYQVDYTEEAVEADAAYFCAQYRQEFPTTRGKDYLILDAESAGGGHYVGTVMSVRSRSPQWFGEGDEKFYVDGESAPSIWGTGTEDYFSNAWGMEKACYPAFGVTVLDGWLGDLGDTGTMYRWHLADPVRFRKSLKFTMEHAGWMSADETTTGKVEGFVERDDDFATVAFWYQRGQPKRFTTMPSAKERKLPSIDTVVEGTALLKGAKIVGGDASIQAGGMWTGEGQVFFNNTKGEGGSIECSFELEKAWAGRLVVMVTRSYDFGVYAVTLDGKAVGEGMQDLYSAKTEVKALSCGDVELAAGKHTVTFACVGKNSASTGTKMGVDSVRMRQRWNVKRAPLGK